MSYKLYCFILFRLLFFRHSSKAVPSEIAHPIDSLNKALSVAAHCSLEAFARTSDFSSFERTRSNRFRDWCCGLYTCTHHEQSRSTLTNTVTPRRCTCSTGHCEQPVSGDDEFINVARLRGGEAVHNNTKIPSRV